MISSKVHEQMIASAEQALRDGRLGEAESIAARLMESAPNLPDAWLLTARIHVQRARWTEAERAFDRLDELRPRHARGALARGHLLVRLGRDAEAKVFFQRAADGLPTGKEEPKAMIAACERRLGNPQKALDLLAKLPPNASGAMLAAQALLDLGQLAKAEAALRPFVAAPLPAMARSQLLHTLGRALEALGRHDDALSRYAASKAAIGVRFDPSSFQRTLERMRSVFAKAALSTLPRATIRSNRPVIIAAPPRSGTTLIERIIEAHPQAAAAGETDALRAQLAPLSPVDPLGVMLGQLPSWTAAQLDAMATRYLDETAPFGAAPDGPSAPDGRGALRIVDKNLQNWTLLGLISLVLPGARAIHIRRDPLDTALSCFERLNPLAVPWAADMRHAGAMIREALELMEFWKSTLEIPILTIDYEALVRDPEPQTRRIIEFIGLPWDDACLAHHKSKSTSGAGEDAPSRRRAPPTLGTEQAAKPIYDSSIGRGARFGAALNPMREALGRSLA